MAAEDSNLLRKAASKATVRSKSLNGSYFNSIIFFTSLSGRVILTQKLFEQGEVVFDARGVRVTSYMYATPKRFSLP